MNIGVYGILVIFGAFVLLLIFNPKISCFGKRLKSPFYPLRRKNAEKTRRIKTDDYGFDLGGQKKEGSLIPPKEQPKRKKIQADDYGFNLSDDQKSPDGKQKAELE